VNIGQSKVSTSVTVRKFLMIETHQVENGCVQVVNARRGLLGAKSKFIGATMRTATTYAATG